MPRLPFVLLVLVALAVGCSPDRAADLNHSTAGENVTVSIASPFSDLPPSGCVPYQVTIRNDRNAAGTWRLFFQGSSMFSGVGSNYFEQDLNVAPNATGTFDIVVPIPVGSSHGGTNLAVGVTGPGFSGSSVVNNFFAYIYVNNYGTGRSPFTIIGQNVVGSIGLGPLESSYKDRSAAFYGSVVDPTNLSEDWRGFSGVAVFLLKDTEWLGLSTAQRQAVGDYVAQGGQLVLLTTDDLATRLPQLQLPGPDGKPGDYGFGAISIETVPSFPPDAATLSHLIELHHANTAENVDENFSTWLLRGLVGTIAVSGVFILAFVLVFGALIGPVNLFVFARGAKRFRLFWTTPLISIVASLALIAGILLVDGIGGTGKQMVAIYSLPEANREAVIQEQIARTAVLFSNRWHSDQNYLITPLSYRAVSNDSGQAGYRAYNPSRDLANSPDVFHQVGDEFSGNWFRSRAVSGQYLQAMRPSRATLTVLNPQAFETGSAPEVLSSFPEDLDHVYVLDHQQHYWTCDRLEPGHKQTCSPSSQADYHDFWSEASSDAGGKLSPLLNQVHDRPGCFYATGPMSSDETLNTLGEIRWHVVKGLYLGPWVAAPVTTGGGP